MTDLNPKIITSSKISVTLLSSVSLISSNPANAQLFKSIPILEEIEREVTNTVQEVGEVGEKGLKELGNAVEDISKEGEKIITKTIKEVGNAGEDLRILAETGTCGGDVCDALKATAAYAENTIRNGGTSIENAVERLEEGKLLDALWHLATDPINNEQENAARAAIDSSILRAVGQVAATAYGGPKGAAAFAAWLTYNATDGDLEASLKAGAIAGATSYAMKKISNDVGLIDVSKGMIADEMAQRAIMMGAVSGAAVALSGGDRADIEQAFTSGAVTSVIRDGYRELTKSHLEENMKASVGEGYCLGASPNAANPDTGQRLSCLPEPDQYITKDGKPVRYTQDGKIDINSIAMDANGKPKIDFVKLEYPRPHVGTFADSEKGGLISERSEFMTGISRIPGMNGMAVAHDIFDIKTNPETGLYVVDMAYRVGTIAPFIVMTYKGAGYDVQEMIRDVTLKTHEQSSAVSNIEQITSRSDSVVGEGNMVLTANKRPVEIRHLYAERGDGRVRNVLMDAKIAKDNPSDHRERICSIDQYVDNDHWENIYHAHYQRSFCIQRFNLLAMRSVEQGYSVYTSIGMRFEPLDITHSHQGKEISAN